jgi:acetyltransferase-like isoleucine patch superfamily enzyme
MSRPLIDPASYRNRGGFLQRLISAYKSKKYLTRAGKDVLIKPNTEFWLTDNAVLEVGDGCTILNYAFFQLTKPNPKVYIGNNTIVGRHCMITAKNLIRIGDNVLMGAYVQIIDHNHGMKAGLSIRNQAAVIEEVVIGNDVWVGAGAKILKGSHIGDGAVIGTNAVVTGDIPPNAIAVGIPARVIKYRK